MMDLHFAHPQWLHALWAVLALVAGLFWFDARGRAALEGLLSTTMQARLVRRVPRGLRSTSIGLRGLSAVLWVLALMRPQGSPTYHEMPRTGAQIMVCLDVSKSMLAQDSAPNRLDRAKAELTDLLGFLDGDQVGLIAFAGKAAVLCPLTPDFGFFKLILDGANPQSVGRGGTRLEEPIRKALAGFQTESDASRVILLITDGEDHDTFPLEAAKEAAERGIRIITIGFGDEAGSEILMTNPETGVRSLLKDRDGNTVITRLDGELLRKIAMQTDGAYVPAGTGALDLASIYESHIAPLTRGNIEARNVSVRSEFYQVAILAGLVLFIASMLTASGVAAERPQNGPRHIASILLLGTGMWLLGANRHPAFAQPAQPGKAKLVPAGSVPSPSNDIDSSTTENSPSPEDASREKQTTDAAKRAELERAEQEKEIDAREAYNQALPYLESNLDEAERLLSAARDHGGTDAEVRFRAAYNMGWVEVRRADGLLKEKPDQALRHLQEAANWFRNSVRLRPNHMESRHNLEVLLRRIEELADSLRKKENRTLAQRLDALIESQRQMVSRTGNIVDTVHEQNDPNTDPRLRVEFRGLSIQQRQVLSDGEALADAAREEAEELEKKSEEERQPEEAMRAVQLHNLLLYMNRAIQRIGMARSQMRRKQAERAFRRAATALEELKRARDQLRNPIEVLGVLISDAGRLAELTHELAGNRRAAAPELASQRDARDWLTDGYIADLQQSTTERTGELAAQLEAAVQANPNQPAGPPTAEQQQEQAAAERIKQQVREATPLVQDAASKFTSASAILRRAADVDVPEPNAPPSGGRRQTPSKTPAPSTSGSSPPADPVKPSTATRPKSTMREDTTDEERATDLTSTQLDEAGKHQIQAIQSLLEARERFLDLKGLIELAHNNETRIQSLLNPQEGTPLDSISELTNAASELQDKNLDRARRLSGLLREEIAKLPPSNDHREGGDSQNGDSAQTERKRLDLAKLYLAGATMEMQSAHKELGKLSAAPPSDSSEEDPPDVAKPSEKTASEKAPSEKAPSGEKQAAPGTEPATDRLGGAPGCVSRAVEHLSALRRLFYSVIEHLRETAQRQAQMNDETEQVTTLQKGNQLPAALEPLSARQEDLRSISQQIAATLLEQSRQAPAPAARSQEFDPQQQEMMQQATERLAKASEFVSAGEAEMAKSIESMKHDPPDVEAIRGRQDVALQKLAEALALLQPPDQPPQDQNQEQNQQQKDQEQTGADPERLLQAVRDRETQRRKDHSKRNAGREPVDKDW